MLGRVPADAESAVWEIEATPAPADPADLRGPYLSGPPGARFVYLSWGVVDASGSFEMFRRAKILLDAVPPDVMSAARAAGVLVGCLGLTDAKGNPLCAAVRPPLIDWAAGAG